MFLLLHFDSDKLSSGLSNLDLKSFLDGLLEVFHCTLFTNEDNVIDVEKQNQSRAMMLESRRISAYLVNFLVDIGLSLRPLKGDSIWSLG